MMVYCECAITYLPMGVLTFDMWPDQLGTGQHVVGTDRIATDDDRLVSAIDDDQVTVEDGEVHLQHCQLSMAHDHQSAVA